MKCVAVIPWPLKLLQTSSCLLKLEVFSTWENLWNMANRFWLSGGGCSTRIHKKEYIAAVSGFNTLVDVNSLKRKIQPFWTEVVQNPNTQEIYKLAHTWCVHLASQKDKIKSRKSITGLLLTGRPHKVEYHPALSQWHKHRYQVCWQREHSAKWLWLLFGDWAGPLKCTAGNYPATSDDKQTVTVGAVRLINSVLVIYSQADAFFQNCALNIIFF